jgi:hypothetical protein
MKLCIKQEGSIGKEFKLPGAKPKEKGLNGKKLMTEEGSVCKTEDI